MKRNEFLTKGLVGIGGVVALTGLAKTTTTTPTLGKKGLLGCEFSPRETKGPFPNKTPADYVRENIIGDREGVPLLVKLTILNKNDGCQPLANAVVDIWHCDNQGNYSEYGGFRMQKTDLTQVHFLRGRQTADTSGTVKFISIFPGYYPGRAPHLNVEIFINDSSLLVTQIALPEAICDQVYNTSNYQGQGYVKNARDSVFGSSLALNMADTVTGDTAAGFVLEKSIVVIH